MSTQSPVSDLLTEMSPIEFENFIAQMWALRGWNTKLTSGSGDQGIDIEATRENPYDERQLIQVKKYMRKNKIGSSKARKTASLQLRHNVDAAILVTTSVFTNAAQKEAKELNLKLVDGSDLGWLIEQSTGGDPDEVTPMELLQWVFWQIEGLSVPCVTHRTVFFHLSNSEEGIQSDIEDLIAGYTRAIDIWGDQYFNDGWAVLGLDMNYQPVWDSVLGKSWGQQYLAGDLSFDEIVNKCIETGSFDE